MRVFLYEYTCAAAGADLPASLRSEGWAMLAAIAEDFSQAPGVETATLLHPACDRQPAVARRQVHAGDEESAFRQLAGRADYSLVIAPESDAILATRCRWVLESGGRLLGPTPEAVTLTGDKLALARHLADRGIATPASLPGTWSPTTGRWDFPECPSFPAVCKPRHGAGSQATFLVRDAAELAHCATLARLEGAAADALLQPLVPGSATSVAFLCGPQQTLALPPAAQHLSSDGRFRYLGGSLPLPADLGARAARLGRRALAALTGVNGYVGVDLVLGSDADGRGDHVLDINPRLTTSYIGLRRLARDNLAAALLGVVRGDPLPELRWRPGPVRFAADGGVTFESA